MPILVDYNQTVISNLAIQAKFMPEFSEGLLRHMILNSLKSYLKKFKREYGPEFLVCCDSRQDYWRKDVFPYYKANRKKDRENSPIPWKEVFPILNVIREELKEVFPHKVLEVPKAEADDIIGTLIPRFPREDMKLIVSGDGDFVQLQGWVPKLRQFSPIQDKWITDNKPDEFLKEHILQGDRGDGIPNALSPDDTFVANRRQKTLNNKNLEKWINMPVEEYADILKRGFTRNAMLIDIRKVPEDLQTSIIQTYENTKPGSKQKLMKYCVKYGLKEIFAELDLF